MLGPDLHPSDSFSSSTPVLRLRPLFLDTGEGVSVVSAKLKGMGSVGLTFWIRADLRTTEPRRPETLEEHDSGSDESASVAGTADFRWLLVIRRVSIAVVTDTAELQDSAPEGSSSSFFVASFVAAEVRTRFLRLRGVLRERVADTSDEQDSTSDASSCTVGFSLTAVLRRVLGDACTSETTEQQDSDSDTSASLVEFGSFLSARRRVDLLVSRLGGLVTEEEAVLSSFGSSGWESPASSEWDWFSSISVLRRVLLVEGVGCCENKNICFRLFEDSLSE